MMVQTTTVTLVFILSLSTILADNPCRFESPEKGVIDLTTVGRTDGQAAYPYRFPLAESDYGIFDI
jgi:hypothetical protein